MKQFDIHRDNTCPGPERDIVGKVKLLLTSQSPRKTMPKPFAYALKTQLLGLAALLLLTLAACGENPVEDSVICCELPDGTVSSETTSDCKKAGGHAVEDELCACDKDVCCKLDDGTFQTLPESECANIAPAEQCVDEDADVCCKLDSGLQTVPASECPEGQTVADDLCVDEDADVCCKLDGGVQTVPASECPDDQVVPAEMCADEDVCCKLDDGTYQTLPASECDNISPDPDLCLGEDVCCRIDGQFVNVPANQCPDGSVAPADMCVEEDTEVCCKTADGFVTIPTSECPQGQETSADMCIEVCCETAVGVQLIPAGQCPQAQTLSDDMCAQEVCCETIDGYETLPQSECPAAQISDSLLCEEEVCCSTPDGNVFVPASQCDPAAVLADDRCMPQPAECVKFRAVDMSALPYTTTAGDTLQSFSSFWGTYSVQTGWSSSCFDLPAGAERAVVGVGNDLVLNFASPVSSIFLLRFHAQPGDDLIVPGANTTPTFCAASAYNNITRVDLPTPSTTVTVQDIDPNGGSGYSVLLAECIEWGQN